MSDELRDRIAEVIEESAIQWRTDFIRHMNSNTPDPGPCSWNQAQAIIDDLGLTVETTNPHRDKFTEAERKLYGIQPEHRVVGKWESR